ncbi:hypothetical protein L1X23_00050, partial [Acinetobacter baumannii]|nr:hypothetical protein [Acinetobacter baumannii]
MEMPTWSFLVIAIIMAVVIGRTGKFIRENLNRGNLYKSKRERNQKTALSQKSLSYTQLPSPQTKRKNTYPSFFFK